VALWHRISGSILRLFNDTVTIYNKITEVDPVTNEETTRWKRTVVQGVQWSDSYEKENNSGKISVARYSKITFPAGSYEGLILDPANEEDAIVYGNVTDAVTDTKGSRISDLLSKYTASGLIKSVNRNDNRTFLRNIKAVIAK